MLPPNKETSSQNTTEELFNELRSILDNYGIKYQTTGSGKDEMVRIDPDCPLVNIPELKSEAPFWQKAKGFLACFGGLRMPKDGSQPILTIGFQTKESWEDDQRFTTTPTL